MEQFKFVNELNSLLTVDGPLTKGPQPRWMRKAESRSNSTLNNSSKLNITSRSAPNSPTKSSDLLRRKTPSKTPSKSKSPSRSGGPTPNKGSKTPGGGDRFIPHRSASNFELAHFKLNQDEDGENPMGSEYQRMLCESLTGVDLNNQRILAYQKKPPTAPFGFQNPMKVVYSQAKTPASTKNTYRYIPQAPDRILDAPDILDDYYLNLMDWSKNNILAAALNNTVYLWDAGTGKIDTLMQLEGNDYICSVAWIPDGDYLAVGTVGGVTEIWNCSQIKRLRLMDGHNGRVASLSWNNYIISSGTRSGQIVHHDVRQREHTVSTINAHSLEVCGLKWSTDGKYLASGGNDNVLNIWPTVSGGYHSGNTPLHTFTAHQAAVKALAWCPWQPHILASGGGTADRHIRFWNCNTGACVNAIDTKSQVCSLLWSTNYKELVSGHGFAKNQVIIWKYPGMTRVAELTGHTARVLHLAMSPDETTVLSAGADETLRLWKCFPKNPTKTKSAAKSTTKASVLKQSIR